MLQDVLRDNTLDILLIANGVLLIILLGIVAYYTIQIFKNDKDGDTIGD